MSSSHPGDASSIQPLEEDRRAISGSTSAQRSVRYSGRLLLAAFLAGLAACSSDPSTSGGGSAGEGGSGGQGAAGTFGGSGGAGGKDGSGGAGAAGSSTSGTGVGGASGAGGTTNCTDECPAPAGGIEYDCKYRFMYGVNYAWHHFGADFGGLSEWNQPGVAALAATHESKLADIKQKGGSVIRWWVFPDFRGDGISFDANDNPSGLGGTAVADLQKALELAEKADVYLMLCLFSFDAFRPTEDLFGLHVPGITPMVTNAQKRAQLLEKVVRPLAKVAAESPHAKRLVSWDVINEPEWAMSGPSPYGDSDYDSNPELATVTHAQMETFVAETIAVLRDETSAQISVGGAAMKWAKAWSAVDVDYYQLHIYDWVNQYWPYTGSPKDYGIDDKPVVMGEFPLGGLSGVPYETFLSSLYSNGYAGALGWQYVEATGPQLAAVKSFADTHPCETSY